MATEPASQNVAQTVQEISERVSMLVREEIELAKAEVTEKVTKLIKAIVVGVAAGIFAVTGLMFFLHGLAWLAWFALPVGDGAIFWGFFVVAGLLLGLGGFAGYLAARFFKESAPPVPAMAIDEAGKIKKGAELPTEAHLMARTADEIRASIEANRLALGTSMEHLQKEIAVLTDWRSQLVARQKQVVIGAAVAGFVIGGGIAAFGGLFRRKH